MSDDNDDQLRARFQEVFPTSAQSAQSGQTATILTELGPAMGRARFRRRAGAVGSSAAAIMLVGGAIFGLQSGPTEPSNVVIAGPGPVGDSDKIADPTSTAPADPDAVSGTMMQGGTGEVDDAIDLGSTATTSGSVSTSEPGGSSGSADSNSTTTTPAPATSTGPTTSVPGSESTTTTDGSESTTSSTTGGREETLASDCGTVIVGILNPDVTVVRVDPLAGYQHDVHNSGPEKIEVSFENESGHCEIEAHLVEGELVAEVQNEA